MTTDIELSMMTDKICALNVNFGHIYLVSVSECWYRVRIEQIDVEQSRCRCFFIDLGDEEWYSLEQIYVCENRFLKVPPQAITLSLSGLEDFAENPRSKSHLEEILSGKILVGEVFTKMEEYAVQEESDTFDPRIEVVLYDTSSEEDINLNPLILETICVNTPAPHLDYKGVTYVNVTHVNDNGVVFCQVKNNDLHYVQVHYQLIKFLRFFVC